MRTVKIKDKEFALSITSDEIYKSVCSIAKNINTNLAGKNPIFLVVLNGAFMFASDLFKQITIPCEISFIKVESYQGANSKEQVKTLIGLSENIKGRTVVIVEDIVETGNTIEDIKNNLVQKDPSEIIICTCLHKPKAYLKSIKIDYIGKEIPNDFIIGYGLDYNGLGRNFTDIYKIVK